jgi:hypothetical protein
MLTANDFGKAPTLLQMLLLALSNKVADLAGKCVKTPMSKRFDSSDFQGIS